MIRIRERKANQKREKKQSLLEGGLVWEREG